MQDNYAGTRDDPLRGSALPPFGGVGSRVESELASLTGRRNWPREGRQPVRDAGGPVPPGAGDASSVGFLRTSERIAPLFARLGSLGESELAHANSERRNCPVRDAISATFVGFL